MMPAKGLAKLIEECGELQQLAGKKLAYYSTDEHPDGKGPLSTRLEDEIGDVLAACAAVASNLGLDAQRIAERRHRKLLLFKEWGDDPSNAPDRIDANASVPAAEPAPTSASVVDDLASACAFMDLPEHGKGDEVMGLGLPVIATCGACAAWENDGPRHSPRGYCAHKNRPRTDEWFHRDEDPDAAPPPGCPLPRPAAVPVQPSAPPVDREMSVEETRGMEYARQRIEQVGDAAGFPNAERRRGFIVARDTALASIDAVLAARGWT